ncbi:MAG: hypothetical protein Q4C43_08610 [Prevotella sp.]|nr:hypothetical protein [Prevotella sp.]
MKRLGFLTIFTLIFTLAGCGDSACYNKLKEVDSLSEKGFTDSAQKALESIEQTYKIKDGKDRAYYSLLKYQLQFRNKFKDNNYFIDDSLINYSITYYTKHHDNNKLALSYYLKGRMSENKDAIKYLKKAERFVMSTYNNSLKMRIFCCISVINCQNEDYMTSLKYDYKAIYHGEMAIKESGNQQDIEYIIPCYTNIADTHNYIGNSDSCIFYAYKSLDLLNIASDEQKSTIYLNVASAIEDIDTIRAKEYALKSLEIEKSNNAYQILAKIARDNKDYKQSEAYLNEALKYSPSIDWEAFILYELAQTKTLMGQHEEAARISEEVHRLRDSVEYIHAQDSIKELQMAADLNYKNQAVVEEKENRTVIIAFVLTVIIIVTLGAYIRKRRKLKRSIADSEQKEDEYRNQIKTIEEKKKETEEKNKTIEKEKMKIIEEKRIVEEKNKEIEEENRKKDKEIEAARRKAEIEARKAEKARKDKEAAQKEAETAKRTAKKQQEKMKADEEKRNIEKERRYRAGMDIYNKVVAGTSGSIHWNKEAEISFVEYYLLISPKFKNAVASKYDGMTERNLAILALKDMELTNAAIAKTLNISDGAVRTQISRMNKGPKDDMKEE